MKKALALVLALVLALSMAVSAFALTLVDLTEVPTAVAGRKVIKVIDFKDSEVYTYEGGSYYVALEDAAWENIKLTANGIVSAELVEFNPETMVVVDENGKDIVEYAVLRKGEKVEWGYTYDAANALCKEYAKGEEATYFEVVRTTHVNVIKLTIADNYTASYLTGSLKVEAELAGVKYAATYKVVNDVVIFEYEEVKWTANNFGKEATAVLNTNTNTGYSDYKTALAGYGDKYEVENNRLDANAQVVSTTAFRAIEGKNLEIVCAKNIVVVLKNIAAGQKGVNFRNEYVENYEDVNENGKYDYTENEVLESVEFGFLGNQVIKGEYEIVVDLPYTYYELREAFGVKVEEDDIVTYYVYDENNEVVTKITVDYMTYDPKANVEFTIKGANETLGWYTLALEVPAAEAGEANPNTGAESVVGVVAALAVVSVATAAAVSLKK